MSAAADYGANEEQPGGAPVSRYIDFETAELDRLARIWIRLQRERKALDQMGAEAEIVEGFAKLEARASALLKRALRRHPLWPWLAQFPGLGGAHVALVVGRIGDPRRFPGQRCSEGHYLPAGVYPAGAACPVVEQRIENDDEPGDGQDSEAIGDSIASEPRRGCLGVLLAPRPHSGVRSLWHYAGLHALSDGSAPRKRKGVRADWDLRVRTSVMQEGGIGEQIVKQSVPHYADRYRSHKTRLTLRVVDPSVADANPHGGAKADDGTADFGNALVLPGGRPLRPFEADRIARKCAAKDFLGDLLTHWKTLA